MNILRLRGWERFSLSHRLGEGRGKGTLETTDEESGGGAAKKGKGKKAKKASPTGA